MSSLDMTRILIDHRPRSDLDRELNELGKEIRDPAAIIDTFTRNAPPRVLDVPIDDRFPNESTLFAESKKYRASMATMHSGLEAWRNNDLGKARSLLRDAVEQCPRNGNARVHRAGLDIVTDDNKDEAEHAICMVYVENRGRNYPHGYYYQALRLCRYGMIGDAYRRVLVALEQAPGDQSLLAGKKSMEAKIREIE